MALRDLQGSGRPVTAARALAATTLEELDRIIETQRRFAARRAGESDRQREFEKIDRLLDRRSRLMRAE